MFEDRSRKESFRTYLNSWMFQLAREPSGEPILLLAILQLADPFIEGKNIVRGTALLWAGAVGLQLSFPTLATELLSDGWVLNRIGQLFKG